MKTSAPSPLMTMTRPGGEHAVELFSASRKEIEEAVLVRAYSVAEPPEDAGLEYRDGLRTAVSAAIDYASAALYSGSKHDLPIPIPVLTQARLAARNQVSLDVVLRRYLAGLILLIRYLQEPEMGLRAGRLARRAPDTSAHHFDRLLKAVAAEYRRETELNSRVAPSRTYLVERLLAGENSDTADLPYEMGIWHLALVLDETPNLRPRLGAAAAALGAQLLLVPRGDGAAWAWLGTRKKLESAEASTVVAQHIAPCRGAIGEPGRGLSGWRFSHRQAKRIIPMAEHGHPPVRYAEAGLAAAAANDEVLRDSLEQSYIVPISKGRDGGRTLRATLWAYLSCGRNISSAAAVLGVNRQTVSNRLRLIEARVGRPLQECGAEVEVALQLAVHHPGSFTPGLSTV